MDTTELSKTSEVAKNGAQSIESVSMPMRVTGSKQPYTLAEAAIYLRMSQKSVRRQITKGNLRRCDKFGRIRIPARDVETFYDRTSS
jgi:hypothetical protein